MAKSATIAAKVTEATEAAKTALKSGTETLKANFDKAVKGYDQFLGFGKDTMEAYVKAANVAGKGAETLNTELYNYSKNSIEGSIAAAKAVMASKSAHEAFELHTGYAKTSKLFSSRSSAAIRRGSKQFRTFARPNPALLTALLKGLGNHPGPFLLADSGVYLIACGIVHLFD